jgi:DNA adenine methylase
MKYMGSKARISKSLLPIIHNYINDNNIRIYYEPFVGGANLIDKVKSLNLYASDCNKYLIALLQHVKDGLPLYDSVSKELYDNARDAFNKQDTADFEDWEIGNIGFLASFNGRFFDGGYAKSVYEKTAKGERYRDFYNEAKRNILNQKDAFKYIEFFVSDYRYGLGKLNLKQNEQILIYCDPPYKETKSYLNAISFNYEEFWETMREWSKIHLVLISEEQAPEDFECIWHQSVSRSIKVADKSVSVEKLFKYKG